jgi:hypothetical protein
MARKPPAQPLADGTTVKIRDGRVGVVVGTTDRGYAVVQLPMGTLTIQAWPDLARHNS